MMSGGAGNGRLSGGDDREVLNGGEGWDRLFGGAGDGFLVGGDGADFLRGDAGDDTLTGGNGFGADGNHRLPDGSGDDTMFGGVGLDLLDGSGGRDRFDGQDGDGRLASRPDGQWDVSVFNPGGGSDRIFRFELAQDRIGISLGFGFANGAGVLADAFAALIDAGNDAIISLNGADVIHIIDDDLPTPGATLNQSAAVIDIV